jgi:hypothetical protein
MNKVFRVGASLLLVAVLFFAQLNMSSCTKETVKEVIKIDTVKQTVTIRDTTVIKDTSILGIYVGTYSVDQFPAYTPANTSLVVLPNDSLIQKSFSIGTGPGTGIAYYNRGTWILKGDSLICSMTTLNFPVFLTQTQTFIYNKAQNILTSGKWTDLSGQNYTGTYSTLVKAE